MNSQELFSLNFQKACLKYGIEKKRVDGLMELLFSSQYFEYKNSFGILFGFLCLKGKNINETQLINVYNKCYVKASIYFLIHGIYPDIFINSGSTTIININRSYYY